MGSSAPSPSPYLVPWSTSKRRWMDERKKGQRPTERSNSYAAHRPSVSHLPAPPPLLLLLLLPACLPRRAASSLFG